MFCGDGLVPAVVGWLVLLGMGLPSSGEREAEHWETFVNRFGNPSALFIYIFVY